MLKATGLTDEDLARPLVGVANTWTEIGPCNFHLRDLAALVKQGVRGAGGTPLEFNTIAVSDGISMGTEGMRASLVSREVIADSIELVARAHGLDAIVALVGCDKTIPAAVMALARLDVPGLVLYGGATAPGRVAGRDVTIQDVFEAVGAHAAGRLDDGGLRAIEDAACPGSGACGGQFTANTMALACEFLGISPMGSASVPAEAADRGRRRRRRRRPRDAAPGARPPSAAHHHTGFPRERDRRRGGDGRLHQRGPPPAGDRARGRCTARHRRLRPDQPPHAAPGRPQARRALHGGGSLPGREARRWSRRGCFGRAC